MEKKNKHKSFTQTVCIFKIQVPFLALKKEKKRKKKLLCTIKHSKHLTTSRGFTSTKCARLERIVDPDLAIVSHRIFILF